MSASGQPARYEIRIEGLLDSHWAAWFEGLHLSNDGTQTVISGPLADQHGLLAKIRDLGLCLIWLRRLDSGDADGAGEPAGIDRDVQEIVAEQAALRRVATLVARGVFLTERLEQLREGGR
jgi:hypothetical protein